MSEAEDIWIPLVDEPIGSIVEQLQAEHPDIDALVSSPRRILAFRTFAYIRVGVLLGRLLVDSDVPAYDGTETWIDALLREERHRDAVVAELRQVAEEVAADPKYAGDEPMGPDDGARDRFREFAKKHLS
ncbi:MAG TPA: hypothetical protein VHC67_06075 [Gaiellaceae bacterium]|nr:hypothetical protein [Gaiellaceae bacterium]